ncbi:MAG: CBS domain-containing protein [Nitrospiraceae bacterium]|nr:CBS domain-containing protein [Nitrospiraceae bacterium]
MGICAWHIMKEKVSVDPDATAQEVAMKIISSGLAAMPVVDKDQQLLGVVSENAILDAIREGKDLAELSASKITVPAPIVVGSDASTGELMNELLKSCCSVVTVVKDGKYVGVVSRHMLMDIFTSPHYARFASKERKAPFACL